jgi:electron transfer flavoprotein alpha subunit
MSGVMVIAEIKEGRVKKSSFEVTAAARSLCDQSGGEVSVALLGSGVDGLAGEFGTYGADKVYLLDDPKLQYYSTDGFTAALARLIEEKSPDAVLAGNSIVTRDLLPRVAAWLGSGLMTDCIEIAIEDSHLTGLYPVYGGKARAQARCAGEKPHFATIRPNVIAAEAADPPRSAAVKKVAPALEAVRTTVLDEIRETGGKVELTEASVIVSGGRGVKNAENFKILEELAAVLGAAIGASRVAVDSGWRPHADQVGQTGKVVNPKLYIACGISGSVQHLAGMGTSRTIVAINSDPEAPIFEKADYGIVGDLFTVVPLLTEELKKALDN